MKFSDKSYNLRIELDTESFECSPAQLQELEQGLDPLRKLVAAFPVSDLYITITYHRTTRVYRVKTSLVLPGRTLATGDLRESMELAYEHCLRKLVKQVEAYKHSLQYAEEQAKHQKGTYHEVIPTREPDVERLGQAVEDGDWVAFRREMYVYEEPLRERVGRWLQRWPEAEARLGGDFTIDDVVEDVLLNAFDRYQHRPQAVRLGDWLEGLIDPSIKMLVTMTDDELENLQFVRTLNETERT